ncbi:MAG TPA: hypothetical protein VFY80_03155, partial [Burkholderiales bacterium]|nr:hypothetical protein [Burkholderiales bacterium]
MADAFRQNEAGLCGTHPVPALLLKTLPLQLDEAHHRLRLPHSDQGEGSGALYLEVELSQLGVQRFRMLLKGIGLLEK